MSQSTENTADVSLAQQAADLIDARVTDLARPGQLSLKVLAADLQTAPTHLQKVFSRVVGISPWDYGAEKRAQAFRAQLKSAPSVTDAIYGAAQELQRATEDAPEQTPTQNQFTYRSRYTRL